jgi:hypothetical protein
MSEEGQLTLATEPPKSENSHPISQPPADAKQLRTEHVGRLLDNAYQKASELKLTRDESKKLREDFPDTAIEIRPHDGIIYISHMALRERLWEVFGAGHVAEICRERFMRQDTNEVAVDLVLMARGAFLAEGVGTAKYYANNPKTSFGDVVESAWSEALRRCCKKFGVGTQVWRPDYVRNWIAANAVCGPGGKWFRRDDARAQNALPRTAGRSYTLRDDPSKEPPPPEPADPSFPRENDDDKLPF